MHTSPLVTLYEYIYIYMYIFFPRLPFRQVPVGPSSEGESAKHSQYLPLPTERTRELQATAGLTTREEEFAAAKLARRAKARRTADNCMLKQLGQPVVQSKVCGLGALDVAMGTQSPQLVEGAGLADLEAVRGVQPGGSASARCVPSSSQQAVNLPAINIGCSFAAHTR